MTEPLVRPVREAARASGYPRDGLYEAIAEGRLKVIRRGRRILVPTSALEEFVRRESHADRRNGQDP